MSFRNDAKDTGKFSLLVVLAFTVIVGGIGTFMLFGERFVNPFREETRYQTQQNSQAYRDGLRRNLGQMQIEWAGADTAGRAVIEAAARQQYGQLDRSQIDDMPENLRTFLSQVGVY